MIFPHADLHDATSDRIDMRTMYGLLRLRSEVLVVEQRAPYLDLDGLDLDATTVHVWAAEGDEVLSCLRLLGEEDDCWRLGRLCTAHRARGRGLARRLLTRALEISDGRAIEASVHSHLAPWYESFGFHVIGPMFHEVGIPHVPLRRPAQ